jgi:transposase
VDAQGNVVVRRQLRRRQVLPFFKKLPSCLVGVEACATSHHWSRELQALGHTVRLMRFPTAEAALRALGVSA